MLSLAFWKSWPANQQRLFWFFAALAVAGLGFLWYADFTSPAPVIDSLRAPEISALEFIHHSFRLGSFELSIPADALLILERTTGGLIQSNFTASFIFLGVLVTALIGMLTIITTLTRFWFFTGLGFFLLLIIGLRIETVLLFGVPSYASVAVIVILYACLTCYFGLLNTRTSFHLRFVLFILLTAAIAVTIHFFAKTYNPFAQLSANAMVIGTLLTIIFIFTVAHEILAAFVALISRGNRQTKSLRHFIIISLVYMINLGLIYANRKYLIRWEFLTVNLMIFITISGILGLWGFRHREPQYASIVKANPSGVLIYLCLAAIGFTTIGYFFATANDPVIRLSEDAILYSHLGYGIIFLIYVINNFGSMLYKNLQAYRVLYRPDLMPYFTFRLAGLICTFVFFAYSNWRTSVNQIYSGYNNAWGDVYLAHDTLNLSESYFRLSANYSIRNYHAHYALAQLNAAKENFEKEQSEYKVLVASRPLDLAYLNLGVLSRANQDTDGAIKWLKLGLKDFPKNGRLENDLALDFAARRQGDSALQYIQAALHSSSIRSVAETNRIALIAKFYPSLSADSLVAISDKDNSGVKTNALALACLQGTVLPFPPVIDNDSAVSVYKVLSLHNYLMSKNEQPDTALIGKAVLLAHKSENPYYRDFLLSGAAFAYYSNGQTARAIKLMREAAFAGQVDNLFNALGLWSLEQNVPANATRYFDEAIKQEFEPALFNRGISLSEERNITEAIDAWTTVLTGRDSIASRKAKMILSALTAFPDNTGALTDEARYLFIRYRISLLDIAAFEREVNLIRDPEIKIRAIADRAVQLDEAGETELAQATLDATNNFPVINKEVYQEIIHLKILLTALRKDWPSVRSQLANKKLLFAGKYKNQKIYFDALLHAQEGKKELASKEFGWLIEADPFFEDAVVAAIAFLGKDNPKNLKIYSALVAALDLNPNSVKLLKVYAVMSLNLDFPDAGQSTMDRLKQVMSDEAFLAFLKEYPDLFQVSPN